MRNYAMLLLLLPLAGCPGKGQNASANGASPASTSASNAPPFSGDAAYEHLKKQVAFGPRVPGMPGHKAQLDWMIDYLRPLADTLVVQPFTHEHTKEKKKLELTNLMARFNPNADARVLLVTHWDTRPIADQDGDEAKRKLPIDGANDGASGTAVMLEMAKLLKQQKAPIGVDLLFVDGEDYGPDGANMYLGANYFAANLPPGYKPLYGILLDMIGDQNPSYPVEGNSQDEAPEVIERVYRTAQQIGLGLYFPRTDGGYVSDDHLPLNRAGIRTIDIIDFDYPHWHRSTDVLENTSPRGLDAVGKVMMELIYRGG